MPPWFYAAAGPQAGLSPADRDALIARLRATLVARAARARGQDDAARR